MPIFSLLHYLMWAMRESEWAFYDRAKWSVKVMNILLVIVMGLVISTRFSSNNESDSDWKQAECAQHTDLSSMMRLTGRCGNSNQENNS